jgi:hypothetical protein
MLHRRLCQAQVWRKSDRVFLMNAASGTVFLICLNNSTSVNLQGAGEKACEPAPGAVICN